MFLLLRKCGNTKSHFVAIVGLLREKINNYGRVFLGYADNEIRIFAYIMIVKQIGTGSLPVPSRLTTLILYDQGIDGLFDLNGSRSSFLSKHPTDPKQSPIQRAR